MSTIAEIVQALSSKQGIRTPNTHQINIRLDNKTYASLVALSKVLPESPSTLARLFLEVAIKEAAGSLEDGREFAYDEAYEKTLEALDLEDDDE